MPWSRGSVLNDVSDHIGDFWAEFIPQDSINVDFEVLLVRDYVYKMIFDSEAA